jgi:hypothetical protein
MIKREVMTRAEWRKYYASMEKPPLAGILIATTAGYLVGSVILLILIALC